MNEPRTEIAEGFRKTEIGLIPDEWEVAGLGDEDVAETIMGQSPSSSTYNSVGVGLPFFQGKAEFGEVYPTATRWCSNPIKRAREGDILVSVRAPVGDVNMASSECCIGRGLAAIRPKGELDRFYLFNYLKLSKQRLAGEGTGTTFKEITKSKLSDYKIPLPQLSEQRKIAKVLSTIQRAIEQQDNIIAAARELKKSLMRHLFTYGPVPLAEVERVTLKQTEIGTIPEDWELETLAGLFDVKQGKAMSPKSRSGISPRPFLRTVNVLWGRVDLSTLDYMDFSDEEIAKLSLYPGDLLVCEGGEIGRTALWKGEMAVCSYQNHIHRLRKKRQDVLPAFYMYWMQAAFLIFGLYAGRETRTTIANLSGGRLKSFVVPLPPPSIQHRISDILTVLDRKIEAEEKRKAAMEELFRTMLNKLMTGQIRVKDIEV